MLFGVDCMEYLLSVIIPTKNRQFYCLEAIKEIINVCENRKTYNVEIVIQDNSDDMDLEQKISALGHGNIKYHYHAGEVSFVDNFSEAVSLATGKYLCMIGDDDGILPTIFDAIKYMENNSVDALPTSIWL